jgi:hypothetical protein
MSTVSSVGGGAAQFMELVDVPGSEALSVSGQLAVMMLETQEHQKAVDRDMMMSARANFEDALKDEVAALKASADAARNGAWLEAGLGVVGCGTSVVGALDKDKALSALGTGLSESAKPLGTVAGTSYGTANAKSAEGLQQAAKWQIEDCRDAVKDADALQDKALDWASSMSDRDAATMTAILSNKA